MISIGYASFNNELGVSDDQMVKESGTMLNQLFIDHP
jgi:hypothetical protein